MPCRWTHRRRPRNGSPFVWFFPPGPSGKICNFWAKIMILSIWLQSWPYSKKQPNSRYYSATMNSLHPWPYSELQKWFSMQSCLNDLTMVHQWISSHAWRYSENPTMTLNAILQDWLDNDLTMRLIAFMAVLRTPAMILNANLPQWLNNGSAMNLIAFMAVLRNLNNDCLCNPATMS